MCNEKIYAAIGILLIIIVMITSVVIPVMFLVPSYKRWLRNTYCQGCKKGLENSEYKNRLTIFKVLVTLVCIILNATFIYVLDKFICYG